MSSLINTNDSKPIIIIVMGVSGCGKSTVAKQISKHLDIEYIEADNFHSAEAKAWMKSGKPLTNDMRIPWINLIFNELTNKVIKNNSVVLAYSGLIKQHRDKFRQINSRIIFLFLNGSETLIAKRLAKRKDHFFSPELLSNQFEIMEQQEQNEKDIKNIDISNNPECILDSCLLHINNLIKTVV